MTDATCPRHAEERAQGSCARCGSFVCRLDFKLIDGQTYCEACAARPDVDYLEAYRLKYWGKRDGWAWLFGLAAPFQIILGASSLVEEWQPPILGLMTIAFGIVGGLFFFGLRIARLLLMFTFVCQCIVVVVVTGAQGLAGLVIPFLVTVSIVTNTRTLLFFEVPVDRKRLQRAWDIYANNTVARYALLLGVLSLLVPPLGVLAVLCGILGLSRVDKNARPPIGRRGSAIAGIVCGSIGTLATLAFAFYQLMHAR
jgi:hypothetical protein